MPDILLTSVLVLLFPAWQLWKSLRPKRPDGAPPPSRVRGYLHSLMIAAALLAGLAFVWIPDGRSWAELGFAMPFVGQVGMAVAGVLLAGFLTYVLLAKPSANPPPPELSRAIPQTSAEIALFLVTTTFSCAAWEVLFRGYLLWSLSSWIGTWPAVAVAATAYGVGHGYKSPGQLTGSVVSALAFTTAYALTHSLWWLMLIHGALPVMGILGLKRQPRSAALA